MKETKVFEVRDRATFMPVLAIAVSGDSDPLLRRAGFGPDPLVILIPLEHLEGACGHRWQWDPHDWETQARTIPQAHIYIRDNWNFLEDGAVIDVEFILAETREPKRSEVL